MIMLNISFSFFLRIKSFLNKLMKFLILILITWDQYYFFNKLIFYNVFEKISLLHLIQILSFFDWLYYNNFANL